LLAVAAEATVKFNKPFQHTVIDNFIDSATVAQINREWPREWFKEDGKGQRKWSTTQLPPAARAVVAAIDVAMVERATGISGLFVDHELFGGGLHCIPRGGFLNMHVDFNQHPKGWHRRVNLLVYLNQEWRDEWGGHLQLGLKKSKRIAPLGGRCVIFETNDRTWHGHPLPLECPDDVQRRSLALYYYTREPPALAAHTTIYKKAA
jgi:hypothetical protein